MRSQERNHHWKHTQMEELLLHRDFKINMSKPRAQREQHMEGFSREGTYKRKQMEMLEVKIKP